jgi:pre-rRNA-processing protein IPI1
VSKPLTEIQKAKLKVGKAKAKAANFTDTSFKAKCAHPALTAFAEQWLI